MNLYRTAWRDRTETVGFIQPDDSRAYANILGVNAIHPGIEVDFVYKATNKLKLTGMASLGDWKWENNIEDVNIVDENQVVVNTVSLFIKDLHVGDAAQTTFALGANYKLTEDTRVTVDYNYYANLYANFDPSGRGEVGPDAWKVPAYGLVDATLSHGFKFGSFDATLTGRLNNVFNTTYISDAFDGSNSDAYTARVYYGFGRTFSVGAKLKF